MPTELWEGFKARKKRFSLCIAKIREQGLSEESGPEEEHTNSMEFEG